MALYTAIVLLVVLVGLGTAGGDRGDDLAAIWGVSLGLGVAHVFAFDVSSALAGGEALKPGDRAPTLGIAVAIASTAAVASVPYLVWRNADNASTAASLVLWLVLGLSLYLNARGVGANNRRSLLFTGSVMAMALAIVIVKLFLPH